MYIINSLLLVFFWFSASFPNFAGQVEKNHHSELKSGWSSMNNLLPAVKAGGEVVEESFNCPHCPDHCPPFSSVGALNNHIKWDHELMHLLFENEEEEVTHQMQCWRFCFFGSEPKIHSFFWLPSQSA